MNVVDLSSAKLNDVFDLPKEEALSTFYERLVTIPITAISALQKELVATIGEDRSKGIFIRYGWHSGVSDGEKVLASQWEDEDRSDSCWNKIAYFARILGECESRCNYI